MRYRLLVLGAILLVIGGLLLLRDRRRAGEHTGSVFKTDRHHVGGVNQMIADSFLELDRLNHRVEVGGECAVVSPYQ